MECINLVDPHQLLCTWFTVVFVLFYIYTPDNLFPRPIVNLVGGLFWILSDSNVSLQEQIWLTECIYLGDYFKLRKKKKKQNEMSFLITW
jgi:cbb3-type cytochrome oxidase subunit 3